MNGIAASLLALTLALGAVGPGVAPAGAQPNEVVIGVLYPLSGNAAVNGIPVQVVQAPVG